MGLTRARIAIDAMGGSCTRRNRCWRTAGTGGIRCRSITGGRPQKIEAALPQTSNLGQIEIVPAEGTIEMHEEPLSGIRRKPKASINVAMDLVKQKQAAAVVSAGHSGAAMAAALLRLGRLPGIDRPAIGAVFPTIVASKPVLILDVGANVDCRPKFWSNLLLWERFTVSTCWELRSQR